MSRALQLASQLRAQSSQLQFGQLTNWLQWPMTQTVNAAQFAWNGRDHLLENIHYAFAHTNIVVNRVLDANKRFFWHDMMGNPQGTMATLSSAKSLVTYAGTIAPLAALGAIGLRAINSYCGTEFTVPEGGAPAGSMNPLTLFNVGAQLKYVMTNPWLSFFSLAGFSLLPENISSPIKTTATIATFLVPASAPIWFTPALLLAAAGYGVYNKPFVKDKVMKFAEEKIVPAMSVIPQIGPMVPLMFNQFKAGQKGLTSANTKYIEQSATVVVKKGSTTWKRDILHNRDILLLGKNGSVNALAEEYTAGRSLQSIASLFPDENDVIAIDLVANVKDANKMTSLVGGSGYLGNTQAGIYRADEDDEDLQLQTEVITSAEVLIRWVEARSNKGDHLNRLQRIIEQRRTNDKACLAYYGDPDMCRTMYRLVKTLYGDEAVKAFKFYDNKKDKTAVMEADDLQTTPSNPLHQQSLNRFITKQGRTLKAQLEGVNPTPRGPLGTLWDATRRAASSVFEDQKWEEEIKKRAAAPAA